MFKEQGALKGLEMLGKHLGMFKDKVEHSGGITVTSVADLMDNIGDNDL